ncbi:MAG: DNA polymerase III subunit delta [Legionellales bacterium]|nr:DNA polymerase III subunit delta [Legionellales bacterium]
MKLRFEQLSAHLQRSFLPIYLLSGDEPVLIEQALNHIIRIAEQCGFNEIHSSTVESGFDWEEWLISTRTHSLFSERQLQILYINNGKPGDKGSSALQRYCQQIDSTQVLVIITPKLDATSLKTKWAQAIDIAGVILPIWPLDQPAQKNWFLTQIKQANLLIDPVAVDWVIEQNIGNLLALRQLIEQLKLLFEPGSMIKLTDLEENVTDQGDFDIFKLADCCDKGDVKNCIRIMQQLHTKGTEPILILWALTRELRQLYEMHEKLKAGLPLDMIMRDLRVLPARQRVVDVALKRIKPMMIYNLLNQATNIDRAIKGASSLPLWPTLQRWCLSYCGAIPVSLDLHPS